jgi:hypothetical protein
MSFGGGIPFFLGPLFGGSAPCIDHLVRDTRSNQARSHKGCGAYGYVLLDEMSLHGFEKAGYVKGSQMTIDLDQEIGLMIKTC